MSRVLAYFCLVFLLFISIDFPTQAQVSFEPPTFAGSGNVFVADFNADGKLDLLVSDGTMNLGNGDGTFKAGTNLTVSAPFAIFAVADFNGDLKPDILEYDPTHGQLLVLLGNGDGTFQSPIASGVATGLTLPTAVDLNGDGKADVVGISTGALDVFIGNGDGTFKAAVAYALGSTLTNALCLGDLNGDQKTDVVVVASDKLVALLGNGDGTFQAAKTSAILYPPLYGAVGDFNGDQKLDLALSGCDTSGHCGMYMAWGNGDGTFQTPSPSSVAFSAVGPLSAADLNGDNKLDLVVQSNPALPESSPNALQIYLGNGNGIFSSPGNYLDSENAPAAIADFNNDGKLDIAANNSVLLGNGAGHFAGIPLSLLSQVPSAVAVGDFDKNGTQDVAIASGYSVYILSNDGTGVLSLINTYALQAAGFGIVSADFNGDGNLDLIVFGTDFATYWNYSVLLGKGDGSFQSPVYDPQPVKTNATNYSVVVGDFNNDKKLDIAVTSGNGELALLLGNGDGTFASPSYFYDAAATFIVGGDFNADGNLDIAAGFAPTGTSGYGTALLFGIGNGTFQSAVLPTNLQGFGAQFGADLNNDGKLDLVSNAYLSSMVALGNGDGTFTLGHGSIANEVDAIGDLNGDGIPDAVVASYYHSLREASGIELGNGNGTFGTSINLPALLPTNVLVVDMNGDGKPDLVFPWSSGIAVMFNTTAPGFALSAPALSPSPVTAGNSATSTITARPNFGFNTSVTLSCSGLPAGATCTFNPLTLTNATGTSGLTIATTANGAAGTYPIQVNGAAGAVTSNTTVSLVVEAPTGFSLAPASGSPTSQTINPGQTANFSLDLTASGSFSGTVIFTCAITPSETPAPTCQMPSSMPISGSESQTVSVAVGTTTSATSANTPYIGFPQIGLRTAWFGLLMGILWLWLQDRRRRFVFGLSLGLVLLIWLPACGGNSSTHTGGGTPPGTYSVTVTATAGNLSHNTVLQVIVQ